MSPDCVFGAESPNLSCKPRPLNSPLPFSDLIFVRYLDHVLYHRAAAVAMRPQAREAVGWLIYDCEQYIVFAWDRDAEPLTLHGGDPKASGLVLLKSDILTFNRLRVTTENSHETLGCAFNPKEPQVEASLRFQPKERKTHGAKSSRKEKP